MMNFELSLLYSVTKLLLRNQYNKRKQFPLTLILTLQILSHFMLIIRNKADVLLLKKKKE